MPRQMTNPCLSGFSPLMIACYFAGAVIRDRRPSMTPTSVGFESATCFIIEFGWMCLSVEFAVYPVVPDLNRFAGYQGDSAGQRA